MSVHPGQFRLHRIQVVNWGTFGGYRDIAVPRSGMLLTGPSGSGKSTLLDAMSTVLVRPQWTSFNAAAQAGDAGDRSRTIASYVRGAFRRETDADTGQVATSHLRTGATWSGVALTFGDGRGAHVSVVRLFHVPRGRVGSTDVSTVYVVADEEVGLLDLESFAADGLQVRRLKASHPQWRCETTYSAVAPQLQRRLGLGSDQAQRLLHKTQSAKNLTSLDALLRDFMLDEPTTFDQARQAVDQFTELSSAHASVVDARRQVEALEPLVEHAEAYRAAAADLAYLTRQAESLHAWILGARIVADEVAESDLRRQVSGLADEVTRARESQAEAQRRRDDAQRAVDRQGGEQRQVLGERIAGLVKDRERVARVRAREAERADRLGTALPGSASEHAEWLRLLAGQADAAQAELAGSDRGYEQHEARAHARDALGSVERELDALRRHRSNLGPDLLAVREWLVTDLGVPVDRLRFAGELIDVRPEFDDWQGAVERVLRPIARTLLVPDDLYRDVAARVDARHLGVRLVYERMRPGEAAHWPDDAASVLNRIELAEGEQHDWLAAELARRFDYACVESPADWTTRPRAVTRSGQVKHSVSRHEKDDRFRVDDRLQWVLGFSTERKERALQQRLDAARLEFAERESEVAAMTAARDRLSARIGDLAAARQVPWAEIDLEAVEQALSGARAELDRLIAASGDLAEAERHLRDAADGLERAGDRHLALARRHGVAESELRACQRRLAGDRTELAGLSPVPPDVAEALASRFPAGPGSDLGEVERSASDQLGRRQRAASSTQQLAATRATSVMTSYRQEWPGRVADVGTEIGDLADYLAVLEGLRGDRLPEFERRFFDMLQTQSRNNIANLAMTLRGARREIRGRIDPINASLRRTEYSPGRHLHLRVLDRTLPVVTEFLQALERVTQGSLGDEWSGGDSEPDEQQRRQAAERRFELMKALLDRLRSSESADLSWRQRCLDTRQHVEFRAEVLDADGVQTDVYQDSGGLSGGERQKLVTFCLAAALRYQLARDGAEEPAYGLVVLDEAFDKTDPEFTRAGLEVFTSFGFQLLIATPLKMLQTLEDYVGGITVVTNPAGRHSEIMTSVWERDDVDEQRPEQESLV